MPTFVDPGNAPARTLVAPTATVFGGHPLVSWTDAGTGAVESSGLVSGAWTTPLVLGAGKARCSGGPSLSVYETGLLAAGKGRTSDQVDVSAFDTKTGTWGAHVDVPGADTPYRPAVFVSPDVTGAEIVGTTSSDTIPAVDDSVFASARPGRSGGTNQGPGVTILGSRMYVTWEGTSSDDVVFTSDVFFTPSDTENRFGTWTHTADGPARPDPRQSDPDEVLFDPLRHPVRQASGVVHVSEADLPGGADCHPR